MARFDVYPPPDGSPGFLLDVQTDFLEGLNTRIVVPLMPPDLAPAPGRDLNPLLPVGEEALVMVTQYLASVERRLLCRPIASLSHERDAITRALDLLLTGF
ncbi:MAG TPA: CcdB family protein [Roseococcus sp.]|jgi:toxin CcdB|nr:CcdB family protein [Roseococcus sp.]